MAKLNEYKVISTVSVNGVRVVLDELPPEKRAEVRGELGKRFAEAMGTALSARPDEARRIVEKYGT